MPSITLARPFSACLICSQLRMTSSGVVGLARRRTRGGGGARACRGCRGPRRQRERARLGGEGGVEHDLEQQVAQLLLEVVAVAASGRRLDGLEHLVGLLEQVAGERLRGSARGPTGIARAGCAPARRSGRARPPTGAAQLGHPQRREVVGLDGAVEVGPRHRAHRLVGQPEALQHGHRRAPVAVDRQLDRRTARARRVALGDQQRAPLARGLDGEAAAVDDARRRRDGSTPSRTQARSRNESAGTTSTSTRPSREQQLDACARRPAASPGTA